MILIVDTNIIFSALLRDSFTRLLLVDSPFTLYAPEHTLIEIKKYQEEIIRRGGHTKEDFKILFHLITENIEITEKQRYQDKLNEASELIEDKALTFVFDILNKNSFSHDLIRI